MAEQRKRRRVHAYAQIPTLLEGQGYVVIDYEVGDRPMIVEQVIPSGHPEPELVLRPPGEVLLRGLG